MIRYSDDFYFIRENLQMRSILHNPSDNFPFNEKMNYLDNSFAQSQIDGQNSSIDFLNQFLAPNSGLSLDEDDDKTNLSSLYFYKDDKFRIKYNFELKPSFLEKIEKESENCNPPKNVRSEYCLKLVQVSSIQYIVNILNGKIKEFPELKSNPKIKFQIANSKSTSNMKYVKYSNFLSMSIEEILLLGKDKEIRPKNNCETLKTLKEELSSENWKEIKNILNLKYEEVYRAFCNDEKIYDKFKNSKRTKYFDIEFRKKYGISLVENYGYLRFIKYESCPRNNKDLNLLSQKRKNLKNKMKVID